MRVFRVAVLLIAVAVIAAHADETNLTLTVNGVTYSNVIFGTVTPESVSIRHRTGATTIQLEKLPPELQKSFGYDPARAATNRVLRAQRQQQMQIAEQERAVQREKLRKEKNCGDARESVVYVLKQLRQGDLLVFSEDVASGSSGTYVLQGASLRPGAIVTCRILFTGPPDMTLVSTDKFGVRRRHGVGISLFCEDWKPKIPLPVNPRIAEFRGQALEETQTWDSE